MMAMNQKLAFILAPFGDPFDAYYDEIVRPSVQEAGFRSLRADEIFGTRHIISDIWSSIQNAHVIVAEMTGRNANVLYEVGLSHAIGKPVVMITQTMSDIPFDLRAIRCIVYSTDRPKWDEALKSRLINTIKAVDQEKNPEPVFRMPIDKGSALLDKRALDELYHTTRFADLMMVTALAEIGGGPMRLDDLVVQAGDAGMRQSAEFTVHSVQQCREKDLLVALDSRGRPAGSLKVGDDIRVVLTPLGKQLAGLWALPKFPRKPPKGRSALPNQRKPGKEE